MKFTITSITEEGVMGFSDNPIKKPTTGGSVVSSVRHQQQARIDFEAQMKLWQEAEANRKEYELNLFEYIINPFKLENELSYILTNTHNYNELEIGARIDGDIKDNQIINIKLI